MLCVADHTGVRSVLRAVVSGPEEVFGCRGGENTEAPVGAHRHATRRHRSARRHVLDMLEDGVIDVLTRLRTDTDNRGEKR